MPRLLHWTLLGLVAALVLEVAGPAAAPRRATANDAPRALLDAFPFNPTGQRVVAATPVDLNVFRPPVAAAQRNGDRNAGTSVVPLAAAAGGALALVVALAVGVRRRGAARRRTSGEAAGQPSVWVSAVFVGTERLPVIDGSVRSKRSRRSRSG